MTKQQVKNEVKLPAWAKSIFENDYKTPWWQPAFAYEGGSEGSYTLSRRSLTGVGH